MICPNCGGKARHIITDVRGNNYYQCQTGLTTFQKVDGQMTRDSRIMLCGTVLNAQGKRFNGSALYRTGDKERFLSAHNGVEVK